MWCNTLLVLIILKQKKKYQNRIKVLGGSWKIHLHRYTQKEKPHGEESFLIN
jgi:hypothetical protein